MCDWIRSQQRFNVRRTRRTNSLRWNASLGLLILLLNCRSHISSGCRASSALRSGEERVVIVVQFINALHQAPHRHHRRLATNQFDVGTAVANSLLSHLFENKLRIEQIQRSSSIPLKGMQRQANSNKN